MRLAGIIEKYFWIFLAAGIILGLWLPFPFKTPPYIPKILIGLMLFMVFLKIDVLEIIDRMKDLRLMVYISAVYMIIIPLLFYLAAKLIDNEIAAGILLLTAMPAGVSAPALTDLVKGNISFSMSVVIITQVMAPFTVPLLFWLVNFRGVEIDKLLIFKDIAILVFSPLIIAQILKRHFKDIIDRGVRLITATNVIILFSFVYLVISSRRDAILDNPVSLIWKTALLYLVFILLHITGYYIRRKDSKSERIALSVTFAYMNNGLAIVLAATYFSPDILVLMILSEIPWNTLLGPFRRITAYL